MDIATHQTALHENAAEEKFDITSGDPPVFRWVDRTNSLHKLQQSEDMLLAARPL